MTKIRKPGGSTPRVAGVAAKRGIPKGGARPGAPAKKKAAKPATSKVRVERASAAAKPAPRRRSALANDAGPLTLEQAQAQVSARAPKRALSRAAGPRARPEDVGKAQERLAEQQDQELEQRIAEYKATLLLLKERGVRGLAKAPEEKGEAPRPRRAPGPVSPAGQPLQVFAEGDSWFDYPVPLFGGGIIKRLEKKLGVPILNLAKAGGEARNMLGVKERKLIVEQLKKGCPAGGPWDAMLFSGGGNDIVDNPMTLWIRDFDPTIPLEDHIHGPRFDTALDVVRFAYEDLIALRDVLSPSTRLLFHAYDFAIPDGRGICHLGPWLEPTFKFRKFPTQAAGFEVVKAMLKKFAAMLTSFETAHPNVTFLNGQGTLSPVKASWHNEMHPAAKGFDKFAELFHAKLKGLFPGRVL